MLEWLRIWCCMIILKEKSQVIFSNWTTSTNRTMKPRSCQSEGLLSKYFLNVNIFIFWPSKSPEEFTNEALAKLLEGGRESREHLTIIQNIKKTMNFFLCNKYRRVRACNLIRNHHLPWLCSLTYFYYVNWKRNNY